jgi:cytochrome c553
MNQAEAKRRRARATAALLHSFVALALGAACGEGGSSEVSRPMPPLPAAGSAAPAHFIPEPALPAIPSRPSFCDRPSVDAIQDAFCSESAPEIHSLRDLQVLLAIEPPLGAVTAKTADPNALKFLIVVGHSTALAGHVVSPINPRAILLGKNVVTAFQRGVQHVELASRRRDRIDSTYNFYLVRFVRACNANAEGCGNADLFTPAIESDWTDFRVQDDEELKNTRFDCRQCHQRAREAGILLMRELKSPWTHWFDAIPTSDVGERLPGARGSDLMADYIQAKEHELYGNATVDSMPSVAALVLASIVAQEQPLLFDSRAIEDERWPYTPDGYPSQPQPTPTWREAYEAFKRGEQLPIPHYTERVTDPDKQARLTQAYTSYRAGQLEPKDLPNFADIFPDDPMLRAEIGFQTEPNATPAEALIQACGSCHNDVLDQSLSRARFNIDLARLDAAELEVAIERLRRPRDAQGAMPPPDARQLDEGARERLIAHLEEFAKSRVVDPVLQRAAKIGMTGGGTPYRSPLPSTSGE